MSLSVEQFWGAIATPMGIDHTDVDLTTSLRGDLGLDSLDMVELVTIMEETNAIYARYRDREERPTGALPVHLYAHGHPLPPTPSGN